MVGTGAQWVLGLLFGAAVLGADEGWIKFLAFLSAYVLMLGSKEPGAAIACALLLAVAVRTTWTGKGFVRLGLLTVMLALVPAANLVGSGSAADPNSFNLFSGGVLANVSLNQGSGDIDFELSQKDSMHGYYVVQKDLREEPTAGGAIGANIPGFGDTRSGFRQLLTFSENHVFSPTLSNTVRLGFNRIHLTFTPNGLLNPTDFDMLMPPGSPAASGLPFINAGGTLGFGGPTGEPQGRGDTTIVLNDGLSWLKGISSRIEYGLDRIRGETGSRHRTIAVASDRGAQRCAWRETRMS